jgi:hypothetical protein
MYKKDWNLINGHYQDEAMYQLINNTLKYKFWVQKNNFNHSSCVISGLMLYGFVLINQIFSDNTKFTEKRYLCMFLQMQIMIKYFFSKWTYVVWIDLNGSR